MNSPAEKHMRIGDILVATGAITHLQLDDALARQKQSGLPLGAELVGAGCLTPVSLASALQFQRVRGPAFAIALAFSALAVNPPAQAADGDSARVTINANVVRHASVRSLSTPQTVSIAEADIVRGYVDVPLPSKLEIRSNSPTGYLLAIDGTAEYSRGTEVRGLGEAISLGQFGGVVNLKAGGPGMTLIPLELHYRVLLSAAARPGVHPWPLHLSVMPL